VADISNTPGYSATVFDTGLNGPFKLAVLKDSEEVPDLCMEEGDPDIQYVDLTIAGSGLEAKIRKFVGTNCHGTGAVYVRVGTVTRAVDTSQVADCEDLNDLLADQLVQAGFSVSEEQVDNADADEWIDPDGQGGQDPLPPSYIVVSGLSTNKLRVRSTNPDIVMSEVALVPAAHCGTPCLRCYDPDDSEDTCLCTP
jgi:hypothetical protein